MPSFVARRIRWAWLAGLGTALWMNRRDVVRWTRFASRSVSLRDELTFDTWWTEARVRAAITMDPVLRNDPDLDDVEVSDGRVTVRTSSASWPDAVTHINSLRKVKGVAEVACEPGALLGGIRVATDGTPVI